MYKVSAIAREYPLGGEDITQDSLQQEMLSRMGTTVSVQEGSTAELTTRAVAYALWRFYRQLAACVTLAFPTRDSGEAVEWAANALGLTRKSGSRAMAALTLTGTPGAEIPVNTACVTASGLEFNTDEPCTLNEGGTGSVSATAANIGGAYNVDAGQIGKLLTGVPGLTAVTNEHASEGGADAETYEALFDRLDARRKRPATSGNLAQYEQWALAVPGVGAARAIDVWNGPGTVKVVLVDAAMQPVDETVRAAVESYIAAVRPAGGVAVTVVAAEAVPISVSAQVTLDSSTTVEAVQDRLSAALTGSLTGLAMQDGTLLYNRVVYLLLGLDGVRDFTTLTVNGGTANVPMAATQAPVLHAVEVVG